MYSRVFFFWATQNECVSLIEIVTFNKCFVRFSKILKVIQPIVCCNLGTSKFLDPIRARSHNY